MHLLHVLPEEADLVGYETGMQLLPSLAPVRSSEDSRLMDTCRKELEQRGIEVTTRIVAGPPALEIVAAAEQADRIPLDVRTPSEFAAGHITGAVNLDVESAEFPQLVATLDPAKNYAVYCRSGNRSKVAMTAMNQAGFTHLFDLAGGIGAWQSAGGPVVTN